MNDLDVHRAVAPAAGGAAPTQGRGLGWVRVAARLAETVAPESIDGIWLFAPHRQDDREWGTAVVSCRIEDDRRRLYTASYLVAARGRERGLGRVQVEAVGETPEVVVRDVIAGVQARAGDDEPPVEIAPAEWFELAATSIDSRSAVAESPPTTLDDEAASP